MATDLDYPDPALAPEHSGAELAPLEVEVIEMVVSGLRLLGLPRSLGEIYGLLFISPRALSLDELVIRLKMSKGSASQGLKTLRQLGAIKQSYIPGERRDFYTAEIELKKLVSGFLASQMVPHLESGHSRLTALKGQHEQLMPEASKEDQDFYKKRIAKLEQWIRRGKQFAPIVAKLID